MGMSNELSPKYMTVTPSGQVTYILDTNNIGVAQVQFAVPASEVLLVQEDVKAVGLPNNPILVADVAAAENLNLLGNNVIVLVSQAQEVMIVNSDMHLDSNAQPQHWQEDNASQVLVPGSLLPVSHLMSNLVVSNGDEDEEEEEWSSENATRESPDDGVSTSTTEDARCWLRDSVITTAALTSLSTYLQSHSTKDD